MKKKYITPDINVIEMNDTMTNPFPGSRTTYINYNEDPENGGDTRFGETNPFGGPNYMGEGDGSDIE